MPRQSHKAWASDFPSGREIILDWCVKLVLEVSYILCKKNHMTRYKSIWMIKIWSKRAKLRVNPVGQDFTFYSCKNYNKSKDANEKNQNNNKKQKTNPQTPTKQLWQSPFESTPTQPCSAIQSWWESQLWHTLLFVSIGRLMARSWADENQYGSVDFKGIIPIRFKKKKK